MIKNISIRNFKSIKELDFKAKRVNVFIGEPNVGKSNILEALGMFSLIYSNNAEEVPIRYQDASNLFYDNDVYNYVPSIRVDHSSCTIEYNHTSNDIILDVQDDETKGYLFGFDLRRKSKIDEDQRGMKVADSSFPNIKFYQFKVLEKYQGFGQFLKPPYGSNLFDVLLTSKELRLAISNLFTEQGYRLSLRQKEKEIEATKIVDDLLYAYPYQTISDSFQRVIFYSAITATNRDSTILLEEPESNIFPFYTNQIAEQIAFDTSNQYFIVTHNPYFLTTITEKTRPKDLAIFVTHLDEYQTQLDQLTSDDIIELLDLDAAVFFNLNKLVARESVH